MRRPSIPIVTASITVAITIALLVGWTLVIVQNLDATEKVAESVSILVLGIISFLTIIGVLVVMSVFLVRRIREVNRQYSFIDSVTHELKSPLAALKLNLETLERRELTGEQRLRLRKMMASDIGRLDLFIEDVLTASRLAHLPREAYTQVVDLEKVIARARDFTLERHGLAPETLLIKSEERVWVRGHEVALTTIFNNLLDNAVKYSRGSEGVVPPVSITMSPHGDRVEVRVTDQGIGISAAYRKRIFHRFFRIPSERVNQAHGTGIGLFVVAELVRSVKGKIRVEEGPDAVGTSFVLLFHRALEAA